VFLTTAAETQINLLLREELPPIASLFWKVEWCRWTGTITPLSQSGDTLRRWFRRFITSLPRAAPRNL